MANQPRKNTPQEAVKQAVIAANGNRMPEQKNQKASNESTLILGENINKEWDSIIKAKKSLQVKDPLLERLNQHVGSTSSVITRDPTTGLGRSSGKAGMARTASVSVDRVYDVPFSPFRNRFAVEQPMNRIEMLQRFRYYFRYEPLVRASMELHTEFPLSTFELKHEDPVLKSEFMDMCEDINLFEFLLDMVLEYWLIGGCAIFGIFDDPKQPCVWKKFVLLNPLYVEIENSPFTDGRSEEQMKLRFDERTRGIVTNGPRDPNTGKLYNRLPADIIETIKNGDGTMPLNNVQASYFKRKGNYFSPYGESLLFCVSHLLAYRDKLRDSLYYTADRHSTPREVWKLGTDALPASEEEIGAFQSLLSQTYLDPNQAIIWNHALQHELIGAADKMLPVSQEITKVEEEMLIGLMLNKGFLDSAYGAYANMSVALDVLISRYLTMRTRIERWMKDNVFAPICRIHNIYKPTQAELAHRIRIKHSNKRPWVPDISWSKNELRDTNQKIQLLMQFREKLGKPGFPRDRLYEMVGENPEVIKSLCRKEQAELKNESPMGATPVQMGGPGLDLGGGMGGGGSPPLGTDLGIDMNTGLGGEPAVGAPAAGGPMSVDVNQSIAPPESANAGAGNTGNIGG